MNVLKSKTIFTIIILLFLTLAVSCKSGEESKKPVKINNDINIKPLIEILPDSINGFTLQSKHEDVENNYAQALFTKSSEHLYGVVIISYFKNKDELVEYVEDKIEESYRDNNTTGNFDNCDSWRGFFDNQNTSYFLGVSKGSYFIEAEFHTSTGYNADKEYIKNLSEDIALTTLEKI